VTTRVKICGLRTAEALEAAIAAGADYVGLVIFPPSPRHVDVEEAAGLAELARGRTAVVALTVDPDDALLDRIASEVRPDFIQLHGGEPPARVATIRARLGVGVIKAVKVATADDVAAALAYRDVADLVLFDAMPPKDADRPGGHGAVFDWRLLDGVADQLDFMLSGGLTPENVADAIRATGAFAVDVSSGVEERRGVKSVPLIRAFLAAARGGVPA
jgi:phosphoribosylanthranilate isomerase